MDTPSQSRSTAAETGKNRWWRRGQTPDYRFSLANERTFLAWIRTALAFLAGAVGIDQFAQQLGSQHIRLVLALILAGVAAMLAVMAYWRWAGNELAMRTQRDLPHTPLLLIMTVTVAVIAVLLALVIVIPWNVSG